MTTASDQAIAHATVTREIEDLYARLFMLLDRRIEGNPVQCFTEDAILQYGDSKWFGSADIAAFFADYHKANIASERVSRHFTFNTFVSEMSPDECMVRSVGMIYSGNGALPLPSTLPSGLADANDRCVRNANGEWRIAHRCVTTVFSDKTIFNVAALANSDS